jgi:two-component system, cell cycle response regulator DivK
LEEHNAPISLLLIHADSDDREMYADYLRREGFDVQEAGTTDEALPLLPQATAVVTGLLMPGSVDPVDLITRVRQEWSSTPVIVLTACADKNRLDKARVAGADAVLLKPCLPDALLRSVLEAIEANDVRRAIPPARRRLSERRAALRSGGRRESDVS